MTRPIQLTWTNGQLTLWIGGYRHPTKLIKPDPPRPPDPKQPRLVKPITGKKSNA